MGKVDGITINRHRAQTIYRVCDICQEMFKKPEERIDHGLVILSPNVCKPCEKHIKRLKLKNESWIFKDL